MVNDISKSDRASADVRGFLEEDKIPDALRCPISWNLMQRPVRLVDAGRQVFEEDAIVEWLSQCPSPKHPLTQEALPHPALERSESTHRALAAFRSRAADAADATGDAAMAAQLRDDVATLQQAQGRPPASIPQPTPQRRAWLEKCSLARRYGDVAAQTAATAHRTAQSAERIAEHALRIATAAKQMVLSMRLAYKLDIEALLQVAPPALVEHARACVAAPGAEAIFQLEEAAEQAGVPMERLLAAGEGTLMLAFLASGQIDAIEAVHEMAAPAVYEDFIVAASLPRGPDAAKTGYRTSWLQTTDAEVATRQFDCSAERLTLADMDADGRLLHIITLNTGTLSVDATAARDRCGMSGLRRLPGGLYAGRFTDHLTPHGFGAIYHEGPGEALTAGVFRDNHFRHGLRRFSDASVHHGALSSHHGMPAMLGTHQGRYGLYAGASDLQGSKRHGFGTLQIINHGRAESISGLWDDDLLESPGIHQAGADTIVGLFSRTMLQSGQWAQAFGPFSEPSESA